MKRYQILLIISIIVLIIFQSYSNDITHEIEYTGYLTDGAGDVINGSVDLVVSLYENETADALDSIWKEIHENIEIDNGHFKIYLGSKGNTLLPDFFNKELWVGFAMDSTELLPRQKLYSAAYAFNAMNAKDVAGSTIHPDAIYTGDVSTYSLSAVTIDADSITLKGQKIVGEDRVMLINKVKLINRDVIVSDVVNNEVSIKNVDSINTTSLSAQTVDTNSVVLNSATNKKLFKESDGSVTLNSDTVNTNSLTSITGGLLNSLSLGMSYYGDIPYPYESVQLNTNHNLRFCFGTTEAVRFENNLNAIFNGKIGVGTNSPQTTLEVVKTSTSGHEINFPTMQVTNPSTATHSFASMLVSANNGGVKGAFLADGLGTGTAIAGTSPGVSIFTYTNHPIIFSTNIKERMRITQTGTIGIGTTTPDTNTALDVNGTTKVEELVGPWDNSDSGYIRLGDVQICWGTTSGGVGTQAFPQAFVAPPTVTCTAISSNQGWRINAQVNTITSTSFNHQICYNDGASNAANEAANWIAIGRWR